MEMLLRHRNTILVSLFWAIALGGYVLYDRRPQPQPIEIVQPTPAPIQVHVVGAVAHPGVYALPHGSRWLQAVEAAGGLMPSADAAGINLAQRLHDGQQVSIATRGTGEGSPSGGQGPTVTTGIQSSPVVGQVDINSATIAQLDALPGIGPVLAERIVVYREQHGPFGAPADIMQVSGIGPACYEGIRHTISTQ